MTHIEPSVVCVTNGDASVLVAVDSLDKRLTACWIQKSFDPIKLLELAATERVESMPLLAVLSERGFSSVKPNAALSAQWYSKAIEHSKDRRSQTRLGIAYLDGRGVPQDTTKGQGGCFLPQRRDRQRLNTGLHCWISPPFRLPSG